MSRYFAKFGGFTNGALFYRFDGEQPETLGVMVMRDGSEKTLSGLRLLHMPALLELDECHEIAEHVAHAHLQRQAVARSH